jgi:large subunit ribosomal protein L10
MAQQWKIDEIEKLKEELKEYSNFVFTDYRGMNVEQMSNLRKVLRRKGAQFHVVKNRFVKRAMKELGFDGLDGFLVDPTALVYSTIDLSEVSKALVDAAKDTSLHLKGGYAEGAVLTAEGIQRISKLPSRQVLIARTLGMLNAPIAGFVYTLGGLVPKFLRALKAIEAKVAEAQTEARAVEAPKEKPQEAATQAS